MPLKLLYGYIRSDPVRIIYLQIFGHHLTDLFPSFFLPNQTGIIVTWVLLAALTFLMVYSGREKLKLAKSTTSVGETN